MNYIWLTPYKGCLYNVAIPSLTKTRERTRVKIKVKNLKTGTITLRNAVAVLPRPKPNISRVGNNLPMYYLTHKGKTIEIEDLMRIKA